MPGTSIDHGTHRYIGRSRERKPTFVCFCLVIPKWGSPLVPVYDIPNHNRCGRKHARFFSEASDFTLNPSRSVVFLAQFWGQAAQNSSGLFPKRNCGTKKLCARAMVDEQPHVVGMLNQDRTAYIAEKGTALFFRRFRVKESHHSKKTYLGPKKFCFPLSSIASCFFIIVIGKPGVTLFVFFLHARAVVG